MIALNPDRRRLLSEANKILVMAAVKNICLSQVITILQALKGE